MRSVGLHHYRAGDVVDRWRVVRAAADTTRSHGRDHMVTFRRVLARCVCGCERIVLERDLKRGRTRGCRSARCRWVWALKRQVADLERDFVLEDTDARARIDAARAKLARLEGRDRRGPQAE